MISSSTQAQKRLLQFAVKASLIALALVSAASAKAETLSIGSEPAVRGQMCQSALDIGAAARTEMINWSVESGILLGSYHFEALIRKAILNKVIKVEVGMARATSGLVRELRELQRHLDPFSKTADRNFQIQFAASMVRQIEHHVLSPAAQSVPVLREKEFQERLSGFWTAGKLRPDPKLMHAQGIEFKKLLAAPGGRELLVQAYYLSNGQMAQSLSRIWKQDSLLKQYSLSIASVIALVPLPGTFGIMSMASIFGYDANLTDALTYGASAIAAPAAAIAQEYSSQTKAASALILKMRKSSRKKRLQALIEKTLESSPDILREVQASIARASEKKNTEPEKPVAEVPPAPLPLAIEQKVVAQAIAQEEAGLRIDLINALSTEIDTESFEKVGNYGSEVNTQIAAAGDVLTLISRHVELFGEEIEQLSKLTEQADRKASASETFASIERAFETSTKIMTEAIHFEESLQALSRKADEFVQASAQLLPRMKPRFQTELQDAVSELQGSAAYLVPIVKTIPSAIDSTKVQRSTLRDLRVALRGQKLEDASSVKALRDAIQKLKATRAELSRQLDRASGVSE